MKFKVGDKVRCIDTGYHGYSARGFGYRLGLVFTVTRVEAQRNDRVIYFGGFGGHGVYEDYLEKFEPPIQGNSKLEFKFIHK